jgi:hypothetical protein
LVLAAAPCWAGSLTVNLNPLDGALTGTPGGAVVWGVQAINSDPHNWLLITSVQAPGYAGTGAAGEIPDGPNAFTDYLGVYFFNNFTSLGQGMSPGQIIDLGFSVGTPTVGDPFNDGNLLFPSQETDVSTSITVDSGASSAGPANAPEPGTWTVAAALPALWKGRMKSVRKIRSYGDVRREDRSIHQVLF